MCPEPDPISNSAVKHTSAHGTVSQDTGESVAARPAQHKTHTFPHTARRRRTRTPSGVHAFGAGWSSPVARQAHNLKVAGSNPAPATNAYTYEHTHKPAHSTQTTPSPLANMPAGLLSFTLHRRCRPLADTATRLRDRPRRTQRKGRGLRSTLDLRRLQNAGQGRGRSP